LIKLVKALAGMNATNPFTSTCVLAPRRRGLIIQPLSMNSFLLNLPDDDINGWYRDLNRVVYDYGALSCRLFTMEIIHHLPEDIRSKIAAYLTDESTPVVLAALAVLSDQTCTNRISVREALANMVTDGRKHHLDWKYMGYMTHAVVTTWFRVNTFHVHDSVALDIFFREIWLGDTVFPSIVPAEHLQRLTVVLRGDMKDYEPQKRECTGRTLCIRPVRPAEVFSEHLELVLKMKKLRCFGLHVMIEASELERVEEILSAVRGVRKRLMSKSVRVRFTWRGEELDGYFRELQKIGV